MPSRVGTKELGVLFDLSLGPWTDLGLVRAGGHRWPLREVIVEVVC